MKMMSSGTAKPSVIGYHTRLHYLLDKGVVRTRDGTLLEIVDLDCFKVMAIWSTIY